MKALFDKTLAGLLWGWERFVPLAKAAWAWLVKTGNAIYDPPPVAYKVLFFLFLGSAGIGALTYAYANSYFYSRAPVHFTWVSPDEGDVALPSTFLPEVVQPLPEIKPICHDMSDTPHCEPVGSSVSAESVETVPLAVAKPKLQHKAKRKVRKVKAMSAQDYFCMGFSC